MIFKSFKSRTEYCPNKQEFRKWFILFDLIIYSEIAKKSLFALSRSKTKLCINKYHTILIFPIPASGPSSRHSRVLCLTPPVSENCSLFSVLSVPNLCSSLESRRASQTQTPSIIKKERDTPYYDLIFPNHNALWHRPGSQGYWQHIMPGPVSPCLRVCVHSTLATFSRHFVTAGSGSGSGESQDTAWERERDSVSEASSCCLLRNLHGYIWYCQPLTRPWLCCPKGRNLLKCFTWNKKSINLKCST